MNHRTLTMTNLLNLTHTTSGSYQTLRWREADSNFESLSEIVPLAPGQMIGKSRADGGKILERLGSWGGILSASLRMPMVASQR